MNFITGGAGFIGYHLHERIGGTCYDNLSVKNAVMPEGKHWKADILDFEVLRIAMQSARTVWHLAASSDIAVGNKVTDTDLRNNTIGTYNVLEAIKYNEITDLVFSSSATYYGNRDRECYEIDNPSPVSLYGASKVAGEALISAYSKLYGIKAWIFRFGNVIGSGMGHGILYDFIMKLRNNSEQLEILGDGQQIRPFFLVEDCIDGMLCGLNHKPDIYNLAPNSYSKVDDIAKIVIEEMGLNNVKITHTSHLLWDAPIVSINCNKIRSLGWQPQHTSDEAVRIATRRLLEAM